MQFLFPCYHKILWIPHLYNIHSILPTPLFSLFLSCSIFPKQSCHLQLKYTSLNLSLSDHFNSYTFILHFLSWFHILILRGTIPSNTHLCLKWPKAFALTWPTTLPGIWKTLPQISNHLNPLQYYIFNIYTWTFHIQKSSFSYCQQQITYITQVFPANPMDSTGVPSMTLLFIPHHTNHNPINHPWHRSPVAVSSSPKTTGHPITIHTCFSKIPSTLSIYILLIFISFISSRL